MTLLGEPDDGIPLLVDDVGARLTTELDDAHAWAHPRGTMFLVIPGSRAGGVLREEIGVLNARLAAECDEVLLVVARLPLNLKGASP